MNGERIYSALLALYPETFRQEYGSGMTEMFRELQQANRRSTCMLWLFILSDLGRSVFHQHLDACRSGAKRFVLSWMAFCMLGIIITGVLANALTWTVGYFYHPYLERFTLAPWTYGAILGLGFGIVQAAVLRRRLRLGVAWIVVSMISTALGIHVVMIFRAVMNPLNCGIVLGSCVGIAQWLVLRTKVQRAGRWVLASALALPIGLLSLGSSIHQTFGGLNPLPNDALTQSAYHETLNLLARGLYGQKTWSEFVVECVVMAVSGLVVGALTARPLASLPTR